MVAGNFEFKTKVELENKKIVISIFNKIRYDLPDYYTDPNNIAQLHKSFERDRIVNILSKYLKKRCWSNRLDFGSNKKGLRRK